MLSVIAAALAAFILGSVWYMSLADAWTKASGIPLDEEGRPEGGQDLRIFAVGFVLQLVVAGMMRHVFSMSGVETVFAGLVSGLGIGAFFISPWIALNNMYCMRPVRLTLIDGGYATFACGVMGAVLTLF